MAEEPGDAPQGLIDVGISIRNLRKSQRMTQMQLAFKTMQLTPGSGVGVSTIKELERHKRAWEPRESTLEDLSEALGEERPYLGEIYKGLRPRFAPSELMPKPKAGHKPESQLVSYLEEISKWLSAVDQRLYSIDTRLSKIDAVLSLMPRPDIAADPPEADS